MSWCISKAFYCYLIFSNVCFLTTIIVVSLRVETLIYASFVLSKLTTSYVAVAW